MKHLKVTVAVLTRNRPKMLENLLDSWTQLDMPENCSVHFLVVENDLEEFSKPVVSKFQNNNSLGALTYLLEPEIGIPFGRNRAAQFTIDLSHEALIFVDDDETVDSQWLYHLVASYRSQKAFLVGGPVGVQPDETPMTFWQRKMYDCVEKRYQKKAHRAAKYGNSQNFYKTTIVTNNWMADLRIFTDHNIWFDESMRFTGGTDAKLFREVRAKGLPVSWADKAYVYETMPVERLGFFYQFARGRDQSNTNLSHGDRSLMSLILSFVIGIPLKTILVLILAVLVIPTKGATMLDLARTSGWIVGRLGVLCRFRSRLYVQTTGS